MIITKEPFAGSSMGRASLRFRSELLLASVARPSRWVQAAGILALTLLFPISAQALDPAKSIFQFNVQNWSQQDGLPANNITTLTQTNDGYLWLGTKDGLVRFDGMNFKLINPDFPGAKGKEIRKLWASNGGGLRLVINHGGSATYDGNAFSPIADPRWRDDITGKTILETGDGAVWTGSNLGFSRWVAGRPEETTFHDAPQRVFALREDRSGRVWLGTEERGLFYYEDGKVFEVPDPTLKTLVIFALAVDAEDNVWVGTNRGLRCYDRNGSRKETPPFPHQSHALLLDRQGVLWIGTGDTGLARLHDGKFTFLRHTDGLASDMVNALFEDAEGSIWAGTPKGLSQLSDVKFPIFSQAEGLSDGAGHVVAASHSGGLWYGSRKGFSYFDGKSAQTYSDSAIVSEPYVTLVFESRDGDVYLSDAKKKISVLSGGRRSAQYDNHDWPVAFAEDSESVIVALGLELFRIRGGPPEPYAYRDGLKPDFGYIENLCLAKDGSLWVASYHGIFRVKEGRFEQWSSSEGLSSARVNFICEDADGAIWAGLPTGMARIKGGRITNVTTKDGLADDRIYAIVADDHGYFWVDSGAGYLRIARSNLNDFADGRTARVNCEIFAGLEAVKNVDRNDRQKGSGCKTADGRIWFPNAFGLVMIDPSTHFINKVPPPVHIDRVRVEGRDLRAGTSPRLKVGDEQIEISFAALSYFHPKKVQVRYKLEGFDRGWIEAGTHRSVLYSVKPGRYTFRVEAANADGVRNTDGATFSFELPPPFYATGWFYALCGLALGLALLAAFRWKVRALRLRQEKLQAENDLLEKKVGERTIELASERDLLRTLLENSLDPIYFKDAQSQFVKVAHVFAQRMGVNSPKDLIGRTDFDFYADEHARTALEDEQQIIRTGHPLIGKVEKERWEDGRVTWVITTKMPWRDKHGQIIGTFGISKDVTKLKESETKLLELHKQLLETSRQAGMAEVATGVLHNVGNVLNSVNVSAMVVIDKVRNSRVSFVPSVSGLLEEHTADLATFLTSDPKGRKIPAYLSTLGKELLAERQQVIEELGHLHKNIEHIKEIVALQQGFAKISGVTETVALSELVDTAVRMNSGALERHRVQVVREDNAPVSITVERHKVIQILVNLIGNAKYACDDAGGTDKRIIVRTTRTTGGVQISVIDNGIGIAPENLTRIFAHGFTTRKQGHGFGLHSGALAAKELGGKLTAHSEGLRTGATFTLELPLAEAGTPPPASGSIFEAAAV